MEFVEVPYIDQSEVETLDATSFGSTVTVRILLIIHFGCVIMANGVAVLRIMVIRKHTGGTGD